MPCHVRLPEPNTTIEGYAADLQSFLSRHQATIMILLQNIVGFFTDRLCDSMPAEWTAAMQTLEPEDIICLAHPQVQLPAQFASWPPQLRDFISEARRLALDRQCEAADGVNRTTSGAQGTVAHPPDQCAYVPTEAALDRAGAEAAPHSLERLLLRHVKPKKCHELQRLAYLIATVTSSDSLSTQSGNSASCGSAVAPASTVVDVGCGQGYLMRMLANLYGLTVVGVEAATENTESACAKDLQLQCEVEKKEAQKIASGAQPTQKKARGQLRFFNRMVNSVADVHQLISDVKIQDNTKADAAAAEAADMTAVDGPTESQLSDTGRSVALVGLHACGILTATLLRGYANSTSTAACADDTITAVDPEDGTARCLVSVGCCYHKGGSDRISGREWHGQSARGDTKTVLLASDGLPWKPPAESTPAESPANVHSPEVGGPPEGEAQTEAVDCAGCSFPLSTMFAQMLASEAGGNGSSCVSSWLGSSQVRELACHALEQYTSRPWAHSTLLQCNGEGIPQYPPSSRTLPLLRADCDPETNYLPTQCYRSVFEAELRGRWGFEPCVALGSIKRMAQMSYREYAAAARKRLPTVAKRLGVTWPLAAGADGDKDWIDETSSMASRWKEFLCIYSLRLCLAPVLESVVSIDRLMYLHEQDMRRCAETGADEGHTVLMPLFDPYISPRNFVLIARRGDPPQ